MRRGETETSTPIDPTGRVAGCGLRVAGCGFPLFILLLAVSNAPSPAAADEPAATVTVTAPAIAAAEARAPTGFVSTLDPAEHTQQAESVADVLADSVGVSVRRFGGLGAFSTLSIRGSSSNQVQIYLDGVPLSRARNETVNLADLPLDSLARIEVYRGTAPVAFGTPGLGGIVNLVTKPPSATPTTELSASYGSFDTRKVVAARTQQIDDVDLLGYVTYLGSAGNFRFLDDNGTPLNPADDHEATRRNNAFDSVDTVLKGGTSWASGLRTDLISETFYKHQGVPGIGTNQSLTASFTDLRALNALRVTSSATPQFDLAGTLYGIYEQERFDDPNGDIGTGPQDRNDETGVVGANASGTYYPPAAQALAQALGWFAELSNEIFAPSNDVANAPNEPDETRLHATLAVQDQVGFFDERVLLVPTLRYEHVRDENDGSLQGFGRPTIPAQTRDHDLFSESGGAQVRVTPWLAVRGNLGQFERAPNFGELFGNTGSVVGNPTLRPETAVNRDIGCVATAGPLWRVDRLHVEYAYFNDDFDDLIVLVQNHPSFATPTNVSGARISGHELVLQSTVAGHVTLDANYTHQDTDNRSHVFGGIYLGKQLPGRPADEVYTRLELFEPRGRLYYEFNLVSGNYLDQANFQQVPSRDIHTLGVALNAGTLATVSFEARNITDNQISDVGGFPLPGRSFFGSVQLRF